MPGVVVEYQPTLDAIELYNERIGNSNLLNVAITRNTRRLRSRWKAALQIKPAPAPQYYLLHWKSRKQQIKVILMLKAQGNLPYQRTDTLIHSWHVDMEPLDEGGAISAYNTAPQAVFVYGDFDTPRQPMFDGSTGGIPWPDPFEISAPYFDEAETILAETFHTILSPSAGVLD